MLTNVEVTFTDSDSLTEALNGLQGTPVTISWTDSEGFHKEQRATILIAEDDVVRFLERDGKTTREVALDDLQIVRERLPLPDEG